MSRNGDLYNTDFYIWTQEQAALLRDQKAQALDYGNLAEEVESLGKSEQRELTNRLTPLVQHLLKLALAAERLPHDLDRAGRSWRTTVKTQRLKVAQVLRDNPSLRPTVPRALTDAYEVARVEAADALSLDEDTVPRQCPWPVEQVLDADFWPEGEPQP